MNRRELLRSLIRPKVEAFLRRAMIPSDPLTRLHIQSVDDLISVSALTNIIRDAYDHKLTPLEEETTLALFKLIGRMPKDEQLKSYVSAAAKSLPECPMGVQSKNKFFDLAEEMYPNLNDRISFYAEIKKDILLFSGPNSKNIKNEIRHEINRLKTNPTGIRPAPQATSAADALVS